MHFRLLDKIYFLYLFSRKFYLRSLVPISSLRDIITSLLAGELRPSREKQHFEVIFLSPALACSRTTFDRGRRSAWFGPTLLIKKTCPKGQVFIYLVARVGFEPTTRGLWFRCSNQLSYPAKIKMIITMFIFACQYLFLRFVIIFYFCDGQGSIHTQITLYPKQSAATNNR